MSLPKLPSNLNLAYPAYHTVLFDGVPMWRAQAWALWDYRINGGHLTVNSANRDNAIIKKYRGHGLRRGYSSQQELYDGFRRGLPGYFPANPPNLTSHAGFSDGNRYFKTLSGRRIEKYMWGIDAVQRPGGDASSLVSWLNRHGYHAVRPYNTTNERHHMMFTKSPATNARKRLAAQYAKDKLRRKK